MLSTKIFTHLSQSALERVGSSWSATQDLPVVDKDLDTARSGLSVLDLLHGSDDLYCRLNCQVEGIQRSDAVAGEDDLGESGSISQHEEVVLGLGPVSMDPGL